MNAQDLRKLLEESDDKLAVFSSEDLFNKYKLGNSDLIELVNEFLNDEEKMKLFDYSQFNNLNEIDKMKLAKLISDDNIKLQMLYKEEFVNDISLFKILDFIKGFGDFGKQEILKNTKFIESYRIPKYAVEDIIKSLSEEARVNLLMDKDLFNNKMKLKDYEIADLVNTLSSDEIKENFIKEYDFNGYSKKKIINSFRDKYKVDYILSEKDLNRDEISDILKSLDVKILTEFFINNKEIINKKNILPFEIISSLDEKSQKEIVDNIENINLTLDEKRQIFAILKDEVKASIDKSKLAKEYITAIEMEKKEGMNKIKIDFSKDIEDYRGLDKLIRECPENFNSLEKAKFKEICKICPDAKVGNYLNYLDIYSSAREYIVGENWIDSVINKLEPTYSNAQKIAIIDNEIGKKISYTPDFDTEEFNMKNARAIWKIIDSGYGVCNGIAILEHEMLNRVGVESEIISTDTHCFLKLVDIELPLADGGTVKGNTILDPTWNLTQHKFSAFPNTFCINYEQARKNDIDSLGRDHNCHRCDEKLEDATLTLDDDSIRSLFKSVGLIDNDKHFPIKDVVDKSNEIDKAYANDPQSNLNKQLLLLKEICPDFAKCQDSSMTMLSGILLRHDNLKFDKCVVDRVYNKEDKKKGPFTYIYIDSEELGQKFYLADKEKDDFVEMNNEEFTKQYECYDFDLRRNKGIRPWEIGEIKQEIDLSKSSGKVVEEEQER